MYKMLNHNEQELEHRSQKADADVERARSRFSKTLVLICVFTPPSVMLNLVGFEQTSSYFLGYGASLSVLFGLYFALRRRTWFVLPVRACEQWCSCKLMLVGLGLVSCQLAVNNIFLVVLQLADQLAVNYTTDFLAVMHSLMTVTIIIVLWQITLAKRYAERCALYRGNYRQAARTVRNARGIYLFSAPYQTASKNIQELKSHFKRNKPNLFVFDPDNDMETFAKAQLMDKETQGMRWLQIWMDFMLLLEEAKRFGEDGEVHVMISRLPDKEPDAELDDAHQRWSIQDIDDKLIGNAQRGEVRIALAAGFVSEATGLFFHEYEIIEPTRIRYLLARAKDILTAVDIVILLIALFFYTQYVGDSHYDKIFYAKLIVRIVCVSFAANLFTPKQVGLLLMIACSATINVNPIKAVMLSGALFAVRSALKQWRLYWETL